MHMSTTATNPISVCPTISADVIDHLWETYNIDGNRLVVLVRGETAAHFKAIYEFKPGRFQLITGSKIGNVFTAEFGTTTFVDLLDAVRAGIYGVTIGIRGTKTKPPKKVASKPVETDLTETLVASLKLVRATKPKPRKSLVVEHESVEAAEEAARAELTALGIYSSKVAG